MSHLLIVQSEFVKEARKWDDLTLEDQKAYLKRHPASKRRITAKPGKSVKSDDVVEKRRELSSIVGAKTLHSRLAKLDSYVEKHHLNRTKIYWALKNILNDKKPRYGYTADEQKLDTIVRKVAESVKSMGNKQYEGHKSALNYIKNKFTIDRELKDAPKSKSDIISSKPKRSRVVKTKKNPNQMMIGHRVKFVSRNGKNVDGTITDIRHGTKYTKINIETDDGQHWWLKRNGTNYSGSGVKLVGKTVQKDTTRLRKNRHDFDSALNEQKQEIVDDGREKLQRLQIRPGSTISIKGPHYNWRATVVEVDYRKGGVRINQQRTRRQRGSFFLGVPDNVTTHYRFIPARSIVGISSN